MNICNSYLNLQFIYVHTCITLYAIYMYMKGSHLYTYNVCNTWSTDNHAKINRWWIVPSSLIQAGKE